MKCFGGVFFTHCLREESFLAVDEVTPRPATTFRKVMNVQGLPGLSYNGRISGETSAARHATTTLMEYSE